MKPESPRFAVPGSKRTRLPRGVVRNEPPAGEFTVRVMVRRKKPIELRSEEALVKPRDRKYLTRAEHAEAYGANPEDIKKVEAFAASNGLRVTFSDATQRTVLLTGAAQAFSRAFGVTLATSVADGKPVRARTGDILIPADLKDIVTSVTGLDNRPFAKPHVRVSRNPVAIAAAAGSASVATPRAETIPAGFTPVQVAGFYDFPKELDGTGQVIAILELGGGFRPDELATYFKSIGAPLPNVTTVAYPGGGGNNPGTNPLDPANADVEVMLDIQVVGSVAPSAKILVYFAPDASDASFLGAMSAIVHDSVNNPTIISISWGGSEDSATDQFKLEFDQICQAAAQMGITVCAAAGDNGSADFDANDPDWDGHAHVDFPASDPYVLGCGGTILTVSDGSIASEVTWEESGNEGTGGGISRFFALPAYQDQAHVPPAVHPPGNIMRGVPDVAGDAAQESGYRVLCDGQMFPDPNNGIPPVGGTSAVAPLWAGLVALISQGLGKPLGFSNALLYALAPTTGALHDITKGGNGDYSADTGWDPCTGLGSPDGQKLLQALKA